MAAVVRPIAFRVLLLVNKTMAQQGQAAAAARPRYQVLLDKFSGGLSDNWSSWINHFQQVSAVNGWTPLEQSQFLGLSLSGEAQLFFQSLPAATWNGTFQPLATALQQRFAPPQRVDLHCASFKSLRQAKDQSLGEFCEAVRSAARLAYPTMQPADMDILALDHHRGD